MTRHPARKPVHEHTVPWFWPMAAAIEFEEEGLRLYQDNMRFIEDAAEIEAPPPLKTINCPLYLLAGEADDITTREQVFAAEHLVGTPAAEIRKKLVPGGHIGLFMGSRTLKEAWPEIARWIAGIDVERRRPA